MFEIATKLQAERSRGLWPTVGMQSEAEKVSTRYTVQSHLQSASPAMEPKLKKSQRSLLIENLFLMYLTKKITPPNDIIKQLCYIILLNNMQKEDEGTHFPIHNIISMLR